VNDGSSSLEPPLTDLRVLEIGSGIAAPMACRIFADFGADVIRVESARRPDAMRTASAGWMPLDAPWEIRRDTWLSLEFTCSDKRSIGLEIDTDEGREAFLSLVEGADVLVMNLAYDTAQSLRLLYADLVAANPRLIYMNMAAFGADDGPYRSFRTWGDNLSALGGLTRLVGWPDRDPAGLPFAYPDYVSALWGVVAVVCAVVRRDLTGEGADIDLSQYEVAISCIGPTVAAAMLGGDSSGALGARAPGRAPHGVYPSKGHDEWIAIAADDAAWRGFAHVEGLEELMDDDRFATAAGRVQHQDQLDERIASWTSARSAWEAACDLQDAGIAACPVLRHGEVLGDPQLAAREAFRLLPSTRFGMELSYGEAIRLSGTPARFRRAAPAFGEHTHEVLRELASLSDDEIETLVRAGVAHAMEFRDLRLERPFLPWVRHLMSLPWPEARDEAGPLLFDKLRADFADLAEAQARRG
jgi:benzylsuccinate CoA-transferase BbsF subunit